MTHIPQKNSHLNDTQLGMLIGAESAGADFLAIRHLDTCQQCQQRLEEIAAEAWLWHNSPELLASAMQLEDQGANLIGIRRVDSKTVMRQLKDSLAPPTHPELLGRLDEFDIESVIGQGGMGMVLRAFDTELRRTVALKVLSPHLANLGTSRQRFLREARAAAAVNHRHVIEIHQVRSDGDIPYLVMELVPGQSIQEHVEVGGWLPEIEIVRYGIQIAEGLAAAHDLGLVHRDVKPANILLENAGSRAVITDFGLAKAVDGANLTHTGVIAGTPHYMAPEQCHGNPPSFSSDVFSLGAVMYFMATGRPPFEGDSAMTVMHRICSTNARDVRDVNCEIGSHLSALIDRLLEKDPANRYQSAAEVAHLLRRLAVHLQHPQSIDPPKIVAKWSARRLFRQFTWPIVGVVATAMLSASLGAWAARQSLPKDATDLPSADVQTRRLGIQFLSDGSPQTQEQVDAFRGTVRTAKSVDELEKMIEDFQDKVDGWEVRAGVPWQTPGRVPAIQSRRAQHVNKPSEQTLGRDF